MSATDAIHELARVREQLDTIGLTGEAPSLCVKVLIDTLLEHERDEEQLRRRLLARVKGVR